MDKEEIVEGLHKNCLFLECPIIVVPNDTAFNKEMLCKKSL